MEIWTLRGRVARRDHGCHLSDANGIGNDCFHRRERTLYRDLAERDLAERDLELEELDDDCRRRGLRGMAEAGMCRTILSTLGNIDR